MENNQGKLERYIIIGGEQVIVTEEIYRDYNRPGWAEKKRIEREKRCRAEHGNRCVRDCSQCPHDRTGTPASWNVIIEKGREAAGYGTSPEDDAIKLALNEALYAAIDKLEPRKREIIMMLKFQGMTERQAAAEVGLTQKGVNYIYHKALLELGEYLKDWE